MRYHFDKPDVTFRSQYGSVYKCDHPVYRRCTLYKIGDKGLAVIQQRFAPKVKATYWTEIDSWLTDPIYLNKNFKMEFDKRAKPAVNGLYPTITVRQLMWALRMKPLSKNRWETVFDRKDI